jgi:di/tricarboxylate transporter
MTFSQLAILLLLSGLLLAFATDRYRVELVAVAGLAIGVILGLVPFGSAFAGFANPAVITVAEILILARLIARSHLMDEITVKLAGVVKSAHSLLLLVCGLGAFTSVFMNNIGALALWIPVALSLCRSNGVEPGKVLIPLSFATLLGGTCSLIGTPANLIVSSFQADATGAPLGFFELAWVGAPVAVVGVLFLAVAAPKLLAGRGLQSVAPSATKPRTFFTELRVTLESPLAGLRIADAEARVEGEIHAHIRGGRHVFGSRKHREVRVGDIILVETDAATIADAHRSGTAEFVLKDNEDAAKIWAEAVVLPQSLVVGSSARTAAAFNDHDIEIVAVATKLQRIEGRLADLQFRVGDLLLLYGDPEAIRQALDEVDCLPLSPAPPHLAKRQGWLTVLTFIAAIALAATNLVPPEIAFGLALLVLAFSERLELRIALAELNWPILIMLAAMIPLGEAVANTGLADVVAQHALALVGSSDPLALTAVVLVCAVALTPFVNNVSAAVSLAPIAAALAKTAGLSPEPLLIAVAVGVSLDFLTPFGHHNNALVMSIGGYRFGDFARVGLPLLGLSAATALFALSLVWGG